ncbi:Protein-lysine N-methyltransferase EFM4 [Tolypocladium ophioglossoides CBS 100239]|uniref:Protein-lysine N-methyltransferase EFM4 n=1 Tax=Tolypocladium ophioglossoides (strain CBS 100239) TaxID=1163406 RepID=A0A0L0NFV6_TOLOC|nr:Protein-lysine N-methyltransferase EFM4 [Tolypocladium ophioglossoides CBS 100239]
MCPAENRPAHLEPSELGTKDWDKLYTNEISNHAADPSDVGTVWFDDSDAEAKMVDFLCDLADADADADAGSGALTKPATSLLDLGCGNGSLLFALRDEDWTGRALGVDYSPQSVALARQVAASKDSTADAVEFREWDIIGGPTDAVLDGAQRGGWDVVLDKGTFDAISLSDEHDAHGRRPCEGYRARVLRLVRRGGLFLVTSCNWTEEELTTWFAHGGERPSAAGEDGGLEVAGRVQYRTFSFGGAKGQTISTMCFKKI